MSVTQNRAWPYSTFSAAEVSKIIIASIVTLATMTLTLMSRQYSPDIDWSPFWPATGIGLAVALTLGVKYMVFPVIGVCLWTLFFSEIAWQATIASLSGFIAPLLTAIWLRKQTEFFSKFNVYRLMRIYLVSLGLIAGLASLFSAAIAASLGIFTDFPFTHVWLIYWLSEATGTLLFCPLFYLAFSDRNGLKQPFKMTPAMATLLATGILLFVLPDSSRTFFAPALAISTLPIMAWIALNEKRSVLIAFCGTVWFLTLLYIGSTGKLGTSIQSSGASLAQFTMLLSACLIIFQIIHLITIERNDLIGRLRSLSEQDFTTELLNERGFIRLLATESANQSRQVLIIRFVHSDDVIDSLGMERFKDLLLNIVGFARQMHGPSVDAAIISGSKIALIIPCHDEKEGNHQLESLYYLIQSQQRSDTDDLYIPEVAIGWMFLKGDAPENALTLLTAASHFAEKYPFEKIYQTYPDDAVVLSKIDEFKLFQKYKHLLQNNALELYAQAIKPSETKHPWKIELLARIKDENEQIIPPFRFLDLFEKYQYQKEFDKKVVEKAMSLLSKQRLEEVKVNINISAHTFAQPEFVDYFIMKQQEYGIPANAIAIELTETAQIPDFHITKNNIEKLQAQNIEVGLDDFGTGFAGFGCLQDLPFNFVKIDGCFVSNMEQDNNQHTTIKAIHMVSKQMGISTVAEYVENEHIENMLRDIGIDYFQGYGISKPITYESAIAFVDHQRS